MWRWDDYIGLRNRDTKAALPKLKWPFGDDGFPCGMWHVLLRWNAVMYAIDSVLRSMLHRSAAQE